MTGHLHDGQVTNIGTYFGEFRYLNSSCIGKSIILMFLSSSRDKFMLLQQNAVTDVSVDFLPLSMGINMASPYKSQLTCGNSFSAYLA